MSCVCATPAVLELVGGGARGGEYGGSVSGCCRISGIAEPGQGLLLSHCHFHLNQSTKLKAIKTSRAQCVNELESSHIWAATPFCGHFAILAIQRHCRLWLMESASDATHSAHSHSCTHARGISQVASAARKS